LVQGAASVLKHGIPEVAVRVESGAMSVTTADRLARLPPLEQERIAPMSAKEIKAELKAWDTHQMNRGKDVTVKAKRKRPSVANSNRQVLVGNSHLRRLSAGMGNIRGILRGVEELNIQCIVDVHTREELNGWIKTIQRAAADLRRLAADIQGALNEKDEDRNQEGPGESTAHPPACAEDACTF